MKKVEVHLLKEHEDAGILHPAGAQLELDADTAQRLVDQGVARAANLERKPKPRQED